MERNPKNSVSVKQSEWLTTKRSHKTGSVSRKIDDRVDDLNAGVADQHVIRPYFVMVSATPFSTAASSATFVCGDENVGVEQIEHCVPTEPFRLFTFDQRRSSGQLCRIMFAEEWRVFQ